MIPKKFRPLNPLVLSLQTRTDLVLLKFYYKAGVRRFLETLRKFAGNRL